MGTLRTRQVEALDSILAEYVAGVRQQLVVAATGTGKAVIIANIMPRLRHLLPGKALVFAHREELVDQLMATIREWNPGLSVGKEMANDWADPSSDVVVSCVASIGRAGATRLTRFGAFDIVVCDEAHHSIAQTYLNVFEQTGVLKEGTKKLLVGFTATPKRHDRVRKTAQNQDELLSLATVYKKIVFKYPIRKAIEEGWLVPLRGYRVNTGVSLDDVKVIAGDFAEGELQDTINTPQRNALVLDAWLVHGEGRQTVGFTAGIAHAKALAELFRRSGIKADYVYGADPERAMKLEMHRKKVITVLFNAQVLTEGYDDWQVSCILLCAPTSNSSKYTQEVGRGTRLQAAAGNLIEAISKGYALSKKDCIVIDLADTTKKCSLVTLPSLVGLPPAMDLHGASATEVAKKMEEVQVKYPMVDFSHITDIDKVKSYIESIDLFETAYPEEVLENSDLRWVTGADGSYILNIPEKKELEGQYAKYLREQLIISQNELDEFELSIRSTKESRQLGTYSTLKEALANGDDAIRRCRSDRCKLLSRDARWTSGPATESAKRYLRTLTKKKPPLLRCICEGPRMLGTKCTVCQQQPITAGEAATAIEVLKSARKK